MTETPTPPQATSSGPQGAQEARGGPAPSPDGCEAPQAGTGRLAAQEKVIRDHTLNLHMIGEQLTQIESWFWTHLAAVREELARTTANNPPTSSDAADNPALRKRIAAAIHRYDNEHALSGNDIPSRHHYGEADAILPILDRETAQLRRERDMALNAAGEARGAIDRVRKVLAERRAEVADREADGMLPFGTPGASWCDAITVTCARVDDALRILPPAAAIRVTDDEPAATDRGPTVAEAAADDRRWELEKSGE